MSQLKSKTLVIIGCGYLGRFVIEQARAIYQNTIAIVSSSKRLNSLQKEIADVRVVDVFREGINYQTLSDGGVFDVVFMIPPSAIGEEAGAARSAMEKVVQEIQGELCANALLISSTGIYGNPENENVTAESLPVPNSARGKRLAAIEDSWLSGGRQFKVLRLAGIYGPGRIIGQQALAQGDVIGGNAEAWLNLVHAHDAASLTIRCLSDDAERIELGSDNKPVRRKDYYNQVATLLGYLAAQFNAKTSPQNTGYPKRISGGKKCDPSSTYRRLQWSPRYGDFVEGLKASITPTSQSGE